MNMLWLRALEVFLVGRLLGSPTFHRGIRHVHKRFHDLRHGKDPSDLGGTKIDTPGRTDFQKFRQYYVEELKDQLRKAKK